MNTKSAYLGVILIWTTTPLAIQWSSEHVGYLFGITGRMVLGLVATMLIMRVLGIRLSLQRDALKTYVAGGLGIVTAMSSVYWGAQFIPSGWVSVVFGLSPIVTGVFARIILREDALTIGKVVGIAIAFAGLLVIFGESTAHGPELVYGVTAVFAGTSFHALSAVIIKQIGARCNGFSVTAGSLLFAAPLLTVACLISGQGWPTEIPLRSGAAIVYLGVIGTAVGFALYFYILNRMSVSRVSLIALITPVLALLLGNLLNGEALTALVISGAAAIGAGLMIYEFGDRWLNVANRAQTVHGEGR